VPVENTKGEKGNTRKGGKRSIRKSRAFGGERNLLGENANQKEPVRATGSRTGKQQSRGRHGGEKRKFRVSRDWLVKSDKKSQEDLGLGGENVRN